MVQSTSANNIGQDKYAKKALNLNNGLVHTCRCAQLMLWGGTNEKEQSTCRYANAYMLVRGRCIYFNHL